jgi:hypothetical protein
MSTPAFNMLTTLADDPRNKLPEWYLEIRTKARNLCSAHDAAGALGLIAQDVDWQQFPGVLTNPIDVAGGKAPYYRARPTFDYPADHAGNAPAAVISVYRQAIEQHAAFTNASALAYSLPRHWRVLAIPIGGLNSRPHSTHCRCTPSPQRKS